MSVTDESFWRILDKTVDKNKTIIKKMPKIIIEKEMLKINTQKKRLVFNNIQHY